MRLFSQLTSGGENYDPRNSTGHAGIISRLGFYTRLRQLGLSHDLAARTAGHQWGSWQLSRTEANSYEELSGDYYENHSPSPRTNRKYSRNAGDVTFAVTTEWMSSSEVAQNPVFKEVGQSMRCPKASGPRLSSPVLVAFEWTGVIAKTGTCARVSGGGKVAAASNGSSTRYLIFIYFPFRNILAVDQ